MSRIYPFLEPLLFISFGGLMYYGIEIFFRGYSHFSMFLCGGIVFYCISLFNRKYSNSLHLITRMIISTFIITIIELFFGLYFNLYLHNDIWNYSDQYFHYKGQICLTFSIIWFFLSFAVLAIEKLMRIIFHAEM